MKIKKCLWFILVLIFFNADAAQITHISTSHAGNKAALYLSIQGSFTHRIFTLSNPARVVIDLDGTSLPAHLTRLSLTNALIKEARSGMINAKTLRIVFDVNQAVNATSTPWSSNGSVQGIRVDLISKAGLPAVDKRLNVINPTARLVSNKASAGKAPLAVNPRQKKPVKIDAILATTAKPSTQATPIRPLHRPGQLRTVIVVLDAGHGGKDPGARGPRKSQEKHVVLAIAHKLKQLIDKQPGMQAILTRSGDYYVGLRERLEIARKYNGDIFVSIHADAFNNPHSGGASVFALSQSGATSEAARWIAEKENYSELGGVNLGDLDDRNGIVRSVLIDLSQTATINSSLQMGGRVLSQLNQFTRLHNHRVEQARFMVLKSPDIPSILVETGFISNPVEERNLTSAAYQTRLSQAIFAGIKGYFWSNPPHGTRIEAMVNSKTHIVKRGETLPAIAARYRVSVQSLQAMNHLSNRPSLQPGQTLVIPA